MMKQIILPISILETIFYNIKMIRFFVVTGFCPHYATDPRDFGTT